jgi:hypothetical protein
MTKVPGRRRPNHRNAPSTSHYRRTIDLLREGASLDAAVERRLRHQATRRELVRMQEQLLAVLGDNAKLFHNYDTLLTDTQTERERAWFDLGAEHGYREAHVEGCRGSAVLNKEAAKFSAATRARILEAGLSWDQAILSLLECLWGVAAGRPAR